MDYIVLLGFGIGGLYIYFAPTKNLLKIDFGLAKIYYRRAKDKGVGLNKAREYYNKLGKAFFCVDNGDFNKAILCFIFVSNITSCLKR